MEGRDEEGSERVLSIYVHNTAIMDTQLVLTVNLGK